MFEYLKGKLVKKTHNKVVIEINGIGFAVSIPLSTYENLPELDSEIQLNTILHVKEDSLNLIGFFTTDELKLFQSLLSVSKIGPKTALNVLSFISIEQFRSALENKDVDKLTKISGIGKKTAQRILLELSGKLVFDTDSFSGDSSRKLGVFEEAAEALQSLGMSKMEAVNAIKASGLEIIETTKIEDIIKASLKRLNE